MPIRRCVGCGREREKAELIRLVCYDSRVVVDYHGKLPGRGAYVCPKRNCIERAMKKGRLERAFKFEPEQEGHIDYADLPAQVEQAIKRQILALLGLAARAGKVVSGWNSVKAKLSSRKLKLILIAEDAAPSALRRFAMMDIANVVLSKEELGKALGKPPRSVVGILDEHWAEELARHLERYRDVRDRDRGQDQKLGANR